MDELGTAKIAEFISDFTALASNDRSGVRMAIGDEPTADFSSAKGPDRHGVASLKAPIDPRDAGRQLALALPQRSSRAGINDDYSTGLKRPSDPTLSRRHRVRMGQEPGADPGRSQRR